MFGSTKATYLTYMHEEETELCVIINNVGKIGWLNFQYLYSIFLYTDGTWRSHCYCVLKVIDICFSFEPTQYQAMLKAMKRQ